MLPESFSLRWALLALTGAVLLRAVLRYIKFPQTPGPFLARFTNLWQAYTMAKGQFQAKNIELHEKYGKIVRLGPDYYSINDTDAARIIYGHGTKYIKAEWYRAWQIPLEFLDVNMFAQRDIHQHSNSRRRYANLYSMSSLVGYEPYVDNCIKLFCDILNDSAIKNESVQLTKLFQFYAFDVIGEITYSKQFGFLKSGTDIGNMISTIGAILEASSIIGLFPALLAVQPLLASLGGSSTNSVIDFANERIREAKKAMLHGPDNDDASPEKQQPLTKDFCSKLIEMAESYDSKKTGQVEPDNLIAGACTQNIFAGSDTTSITLTATLFSIIKRPNVLQKLRTELDEAAQKGELSDPPLFSETQKLPYFQAVMKESLRLHPAVGFPLWREVPTGGATISGTYFPAGTSVGINPWVAHRNRDVWGHDAEDFRPERWMESSEDQLREMNAMYMPFGLGSRTCIGKNISLLEVSKLIPQVLRKFDMNIVRGVGEDGELKSRCAWFVKQKELLVTVKKHEIC